LANFPAEEELESLTEHHAQLFGQARYLQQVNRPPKPRGKKAEKISVMSARRASVLSKCVAALARRSRRQQ